jgi:hypothetical protein
MAQGVTLCDFLLMEMAKGVTLNDFFKTLNGFFKAFNGFCETFNDFLDPLYYLIMTLILIFQSSNLTTANQ